jgi:nucleoid-associated protein YejK
MNLDLLIVHQIIKVDAAAGGQLIGSDRSIDNNERAIHFVSELTNRYRSIKQSNGNFRTENNLFYLQFHGYHNGGSEETFVQFTQLVMPGFINLNSN